MAALQFVAAFWVLCFVSLSRAQGCGGRYTSLTGTITSPNFPNNYTNLLNCVYVIVAPVGYRVTVNFSHFDLEVVRGCDYDYVEIRDGAEATDQVIDKLCNESVPFARRSFGHEMRITFVTDSSNTGSGFRATFTAARGDDSFLLIATSGQLPGSILRMDTRTITNYAVNISATLNNPIAVDYDPVEKRIYWTEVDPISNAVRSVSLSGGGVTTVHSAGFDATLDGLAVDPLSRLLFYTDAGNDEIAMLTMSTVSKKTLVNTDLDKPRAIVLNTADGVMFWSDWGTIAKIERANYDGSDRRTLVNFNLYYTNALALDIARNRLYWADAGTDRVESCRLDGSDRELLLLAKSSRHFFGLALFEGALYITDWGPDGFLSTESLLVRQPLDVVNENLTVVGGSVKRLNDIHAYHQDVLKTGPNGCGSNNGGCSVFCIPLPGNSSKCMCPDGQRLASDGRSCVTDDGTTTTTTTTTPSTSSPQPSDVRVFVTASERLPFATDGSQELTLTCRPDTTSQVTRYQWSVSCARQTGNTCVFLPQPEDDGIVVACTVTLADGRHAIGRLQLLLEYPPQTPPVINDFKKDDILQAGTDLRLTCSVQGGQPLVTNVIFTCDGRPDTAPDIRGQSEVHSVLEFSPLTSDDDGKRCVCTAEWKDTDWYHLSATIVLKVNETVPEGTQDEQRTGPNVPLIAGAAAAGVVVIVVVIIVVVVILKRRNRHPTYDRPGKRRRSGQQPDRLYTGLGHVGDDPFAISNGSFDMRAASGSGGWDADAENNRNSSIYSQPMDVPDELPPPVPCRPSLPTVLSSGTTDSYLHPTTAPTHGYSTHIVP